MRADMPKVLVERERGGMRLEFGPRRHAFERATRGFHGEGELPSRMPMRFGRTKWLNENLGPMKRFLRARIGRRWDAVYAEIRARLAPKSAVDMHVLQHLGDFVLFARRERDGRVWLVHDDGRYAYERLPDGALRPHRYRSAGVFYVCCDTGLLRHVRAPRRKGRLRRACP